MATPILFLQSRCMQLIRCYIVCILNCVLNSWRTCEFTSGNHIHNLRSTHSTYHTIPTHSARNSCFVVRVFIERTRLVHESDNRSPIVHDSIMEVALMFLEQSCRRKVFFGCLVCVGVVFLAVVAIM